MEQLIAAFNAGDLHSGIMTALVLLLSNYAKDIVKDVVVAITTGLHYLSDRAATQQNQILAQVEQRLLDKVADAVEGIMPLADDLKKLTADGKLTPEDIKTLQTEAFDLFIDTLTPKDWVDFATHLINPAQPNAPKEFVAAKLERRFKAIQPKVISQVKVMRRQRDLLSGDNETLKKS